MGPYELLQIVANALKKLKIPYIVTGSVASMAYGEPRLTNDIDIVASITKKHIPGLLKSFPEDKFYISEDAIEKAIKKPGQFNIIHPVSGLKIDIIVKKDTPFDDSRFERARQIQPSKSYRAHFASPEDVIIKKMEFYKDGGSEKHLRDITGILKISGKDIDKAYIAKWSKRLGLVKIWNSLLKRISD